VYDFSAGSQCDDASQNLLMYPGVPAAAAFGCVAAMSNDGTRIASLAFEGFESSLSWYANAFDCTPEGDCATLQRYLGTFSGSTGSVALSGDGLMMAVGAPSAPSAPGRGLAFLVPLAISRSQSGTQSASGTVSLSKTQSMSVTATHTLQQTGQAPSASDSSSVRVDLSESIAM
jgi:hypothetical protein